VVDAEPSAAPTDSAEQKSAVEPIEPERMILLTPRGPLVVHLQIAIGDQPQAAVAARMLDEAFRLAAGEAKDVAWETLARDARFASGLLGNLPLADDEARERASENLDLNRNKRVDRDELAAFLAQGDAEGREFSVARMQGRGGSEDGQWSALSMVDEDGDGRLSAQERASAGARLLGRDDDDDEVLTPADFVPPQAARRAMNTAGDEPARAFEFTPARSTASASRCGNRTSPAAGSTPRDSPWCLVCSPSWTKTAAATSTSGNWRASSRRGPTSC
jgi:hypothetical protein